MNTTAEIQPTYLWQELYKDFCRDSLVHSIKADGFSIVDADHASRSKSILPALGKFFRLEASVKFGREQTEPL